MTDQDQIRAIAELDGNCLDGYMVHWKPYLISRDVVVQVIEKMDCNLRNDFIANLWTICGNHQDSANFWTEYNFRGFYSVLVATPPKLCEALLRATGRWRE